MALVPVNNEDLKEYAVLHNDIVDKYSFKDLTEREENILIVLLSKLQKQEAFSKVSLKEIKNMIDKSMTYKTLSEDILNLGNKRLFLIAEKEIKDNKGNIISKKDDLWRPVIFSTVIIHDDEKNVSVRFNPDIEYLFWQMKEEFEKVNPHHYLKIKSQNWKAFYRLCKRWENYPNRVEITVDNLKRILMYDDNMEYKTLKRRLNAVIKKVNEITTLHVEFEEKKKGRKINSLIFSIKSLKEQIRESIPNNELENKYLQMAKKFIKA